METHYEKFGDIFLSFLKWARRELHIIEINLGLSESEKFKYFGYSECWLNLNIMVILVTVNTNINFYAEMKTKIRWRNNVMNKCFEWEKCFATYIYYFLWIICRPSPVSSYIFILIDLILAFYMKIIPIKLVVATDSYQ